MNQASLRQGKRNFRRHQQAIQEKNQSNADRFRNNPRHMYSLGARISPEILKQLIG